MISLPKNPNNYFTPNEISFLESLINELPQENEEIFVFIYNLLDKNPHYKVKFGIDKHKLISKLIKLKRLLIIPE